jgi:hypothetical protein
MATSEVCPVEPVERRKREWKTCNGSLISTGPNLYIALLLAVAVGACAYGLRKYGIFSCTASGYKSGAYLAYCNSTGYGDYDHGAFWFRLEPDAAAAAAHARVLFLGNSRTEFAFSTKTTARWFAFLQERYYILGFSHSENYTFETPLLRQLRAKPKVLVINIDSFFERSETAPGRAVMREEATGAHYEEKRRWQQIHRAVCSAVSAVCGNQGAFFRFPADGAWFVTGGPFQGAPVSYDESVDKKQLAAFTALAKDILPRMEEWPACTILTVVPARNTQLGTARALALALGSKLVAPVPPRLATFDGVHLDPESAERWSTAFFQQAGPQVRKCLGK